MKQAMNEIAALCLGKTHTRVTAGFDSVRTLLEDFENVMGQVLVAKEDVAQIRPSLEAALLARMLGNKSIDYTKKHCVDGRPIQRKPDPYEEATAAYVTAYRASKAYIFAALDKLAPKGKRDPTPGEFGASVAQAA